MSTETLSADDLISETSEHSTARFTLWHLAMVFVVIGLLVAGYLSYVKLTDVPMQCIADGPFSCSVVQNSIYSRFMNIPIAWLGLGVYIILGTLLLLEKRVAFLQEYGHLIVFGITLFAWVYSMYLVYLQFFVLEALCQWCLMHETNITLLFVVVSIRLWRHLNSDIKVKE